MLQINMADVMNVIGSLTPYLIAIGVLFVLALIVTFAVNKKTVKEVATRKIIHSESWLVALVGIVVAASMMLTSTIWLLSTPASPVRKLPCFRPSLTMSKVFMWATSSMRLQPMKV